MTNTDKMQEIKATLKLTCNNDDIKEKYTIKDQTIISELEAIAEINNGEINECYINKYGLTPRHIKETFGGKYKTILNY